MLFVAHKKKKFRGGKSDRLLGSFGVSRDLLIDAAGGIDNSGAALRAGGRMQLFGGALNNQAGTLQAGSLYAGIDGAILTQGGSIQTQGNTWLGASGAIQAQRSDLSSSSGNFILSAGGEIDLTSASLRSASGRAGALAGGNIALDHTSVDGNTIDLRATGNIQGNAVTLTSRGDTTLQAGGNLQIGAQALHASSGSGINSVVSDTWQGSTITSQAGNVSASAGGLLDIQGSDLIAGGKLQLSGQQVRIQALQARSQSRSEEETGGERFIRGSQTLTSTGGLLQGGTGVSIAATGELTLQGVRIESGASVTLSGANVSISANVDSSGSESLRSGRNQFAHTTSEQESLSGGSVQATGDISIVANSQNAASGNIALAGAQLSATGAVQLLATGDIDLAAISTQASASQDSSRKQSGWFSSSTTTQSASSSQSQAVVSSLSGSAVSLVAGNNIILEGTKITAQRDATLYAGNDLLALAARSSNSASQSAETSKSGIFFEPSLIGIRPETRSAGDSRTGAGSTGQGASISSAEGKVTLYGAPSVGLEGAALSAPQGSVTVVGGAVDIRASVDTASSSSLHTERGANINALGRINPSEGIGRKTSQIDETGQTSLTRSSLSGQSITISATDGDLHIAGASLSATGVPASPGSPGTAGKVSLNAPNGVIALDGQQTEVASRSERYGRDLMYQKASGQGGSEQRAQYNLIDAGRIELNAPKITAQIGSKDSAAQLATQPGMA